jgi:hypothetical protein
LVILGLSTVLAIDSPFRDEILLVGDFVSCLVWFPGRVVRLEWDGMVSVTMFMFLRAMRLMQFSFFFPDYDWVLIA